MKKLSNTEAELKKNVANKKNRVCGNVQGHLQSSVYLFDIVFAIAKFSFCGAIFMEIEFFSHWSFSIF